MKKILFVLFLGIVLTVALNFPLVKAQIILSNFTSVDDVYVQGSASPPGRNIFIKFEIGTNGVTIPLNAQIVQAHFGMWATQAANSPVVGVTNCSNQSWYETANIDTLASMSCSMGGATKPVNTIDTDNKWYEWDVTTMVDEAFASNRDNITFLANVTVPSFTVTSNTATLEIQNLAASLTKSASFNSSEATGVGVVCGRAGCTPYLEITYTECNCPSSGDWIIDDGEVCVLTSVCNLNTNKFLGINGKLLINSGGKLLAKKLAVDVTGFKLAVNVKGGGKLAIHK